MNGDDYLWDRSGTPDPTIERLERLLAAQAWPAHRLPRTLPATRRRARWPRVALALAASLLLCALAGVAWLQFRLAWPDGAGWRIADSRGAVHGLTTIAGAAELRAGGELATGSDGEVRLQVARIGEIRLAPDSRLRLLQTASGRHRVGLLHGRMRVRVWAPPMQFGVDLPGAQLWDLGCEFELASDHAGNGELTVRSGWVLLERAAGEVLVPQGARVALVAGAAAGTPHDLGASQAFREALRAFDDGPAQALAAQVAASAGPGDAISLLSLLQRHPWLAHGPVYDRLRELLPQAPALSRAAIAAGATSTLQPWWDALPYPPAKRWWWHWRDALPAAQP